MKLSELAEQLENQMDIALLLSIILLRRLGGKVEFGNAEIQEARGYSIKRGVNLEDGRFTATTVATEPEATA